MRALLLATCVATLALVPDAQPRTEPITRSTNELHFAEIDLATGIRMRYAAQGPAHGAPVVLLHGVTDSWFSFSRVLPLLPEGNRYFALDQRGHGGTSKPHSSYRMRELALDVIAFMDAQRIERFTVVGHSMGSLVAQQVAALAPERIERLVLIGSRANGRGLEPLDTIIQALPDPLPAEFIREFQYGSVFRSVPEEFMVNVLSESARVPARVLQGVMRDLMTYEAPAALARTQFPALIMWGDQDAAFPKEQQELLRALIPEARFLVYERTGHSPHWEQPAAFAQDLATFLAEK